MFDLLIVLILSVLITTIVVKPIKIIAHRIEEYVVINGQWILCDGKKCGLGRHAGGGSYLCPHYNLKVKCPKLVLQWHDRNPVGPENYTPFSTKSVWWKCEKDPCGCHEWFVSISSRNQHKTGCPFCAPNGIPCIHNNFKVTCPELVIQWHPKNPYGPEEYLPHSGKYVWWKCEKNPCGCHIWRASINSRTKGHKCPFCDPNTNRPCIHNNFKVKAPHLISEWDPTNLSPEEYTLYSAKWVKWICKVDPIHKWTSKISDRTSLGNGCPHCAVIRFKIGYSKAAIDWIQSIEGKENIKIHYMDPEKGIQEYLIWGIGRVDGYCKENNTVYEFHGDYWHGNPNLFNSQDINQTNGKIFGELYKNTIERDNKIKELGYNLIVKWET